MRTYTPERPGTPDDLAAALGSAVTTIVRSLGTRPAPSWRPPAGGRAPSWPPMGGRRRWWEEDPRERYRRAPDGWEPGRGHGRGWDHGECGCSGGHSHHGHDCDHHHGHDDCCAGECGSDPCHCACCVGDVDLVVYARLGETRVVPVRLENTRKREREVSLELSEFTTKGGRDAAVSGAVVGERSFTLAPCSTHEAILVIRVGTQPDRPQPALHVGEDRPDTHDEQSGEDASREGRPPVDVDDCLVAVADLRVVGCDARPVRLAVAVLPRDCDAFEISCDCGCC